MLAAPSLSSQKDPLIHRDCRAVSLPLWLKFPLFWRCRPRALGEEWASCSEGKTMIQAIVVVREIGKLKREYSLEFEFPELPKVGDYISIHRPDLRKPLGEDLIVKAIWWQLEHSETHGYSNSKAGTVREIFVECDVAIGPYASEAWRTKVEAAKERGIEVPKFQVERW
jgi:hypothetical protein